MRLTAIPFLIDGGAAKKINKLLNVKPNPFEDRVRLFRRAFLDFYLDGNAFFYYDKEKFYIYYLQMMSKLLRIQKLLSVIIII